MTKPKLEVLDVGRCFRDAFEVYKQNLGTLVVATILFDVLSVVTLMLLAPPLAGGMSLLVVRAIRSKEQKADLNDLFRGFTKFLPLFGLFWLTFVPIVLGLLLIVPGLLLMTIWMFCFLLVVDRNAGVFESLRSSQQMVKQAGFGNCILLTVVGFALSIAPAAVPFPIGWIVGWFITPLA